MLSNKKLADDYDKAMEELVALKFKFEQLQLMLFQRNAQVHKLRTALERIARAGDRISWQADIAKIALEETK